MKISTLATFITFIGTTIATSASTIVPTPPPTISSSSNATNNSCEHAIELFAISNNGTRTGISYYHEGAGINYLFLAGENSPVYTYNHCNNQIYSTFEENYKFFFSEVDGFVQFSVVGPNGDFTIDDSYLAIDGETSGWLACKNTSDPYNYSTNIPQLAFTGTSFTECEPIVVQAVAA